MNGPRASPVPCETHPRLLCQFSCPYLQPFFLGEETPIGRALCEVRLTRGIDAFVASMNRHDREAGGRLDEITAAWRVRAWLERASRLRVLSRTDPEAIKRRLAKYVRTYAVAPVRVSLEDVRVQDPRANPSKVSEPLEEVVRRLCEKWDELLQTWPGLDPAQCARYSEAFRQTLTRVQEQLDGDVPAVLEMLKKTLEALGAGPEDVARVDTLFVEFRRRCASW